MKIPTWVYGLIAIVFFVLNVHRIANNQAQYGWLWRREGMVNKKCPDGTRSDGPCLLEFPSS